MIPTTQTQLLGLMHGHWNIRPKQMNDCEFDAVADDNTSVAVGLSLVVPAKKILEIRYCPSFALLLFDDVEVLKHGHNVVNQHGEEADAGQDKECPRGSRMPFQG